MSARIQAQVTKVSRKPAPAPIDRTSPSGKTTHAN